MGIINLDTTNMEQQSGGRDTFTEGWTQVIIADSKGAETASKNGYGVALYLKAVSGENKDKTIDDYINVFHNSAQAQEIGQRQLSSYTHAIGVFKLDSDHLEELRNKPFWVKTVLVEEEFENAKGETIKTKKSKVKDWDTVNGTKHGSGSAGSASSAGKEPPAKAADEAPKAAWGAPPPETEGKKAAPWGGGGAAAGASEEAPAEGSKSPPWGK